MIDLRSAKPIKFNCTEQGFPEFPKLKLGTTNDTNVTLFDVSEYLQGFTSSTTIEGFFLAFNHQIKTLLKSYDLKESEVVFINESKHILLDSCLMYLFLSYVEPHFLAHINDKIHEMFAEGVCISDSYLLMKARKNLTPDIIFPDDYGRGRQELASASIQ
jgi:hypothetical protein